jgi:hypothetical protein
MSNMRSAKAFLLTLLFKQQTKTFMGRWFLQKEMEDNLPVLSYV